MNEGQMLAVARDETGTEKLRINLGENLGLGGNTTWAKIGEALEEKKEPQRNILRERIAEMKGLPITATWEELSR